MSALSKDAKVAVIGAGAMGAGIAQVAALAGHPVKLHDNRPGAAAQAIDGIDRQLGRLVEKGKLDAAARGAIAARLQPVESIEALADSALVIEAIVENLEIKRSLLQQLETLCGENCILASNTSSLSITSLAAGLKRPQRVAGMHFFNPAPLMALVEVVSGLATDPAVAASLYATSVAWGKKPVHTRSTPGFIVNRVARPFYAESLRLLQEGAADCATLDALMRDAGGFRMGAFELTDLIGHDVNYAVTCSVFAAYYGDFRFQPSLIQKELVDAGRLGRKSGHGFYDYAEGAERPQPASLSSAASIAPCVLEGDLGVAQPLVQRLKDAGIEITQRAGSGLLRVGDAVLALSDGRLASQRAREDGLRNLVLIDLALGYSKASRLGISASADTSPEALDQVVALLAKAGITTSRLSDTPGLAVLRTVAMLANEGADAVLHGVGSAGDIDLAMRAGVNYPQGPLAWAEQIGIGNLLRVLDNLNAAYGEDRYRPSLLLRRLHAERRTFHD
ncbi:3-hydroxyacyl-CoA dehydrogenase PaaC [Pseudomonas sp. ZM23]|uniref:3-hydroxyacyl-CoA dehydrogenase PaaC n=1 Tax=Pseudomonas triclosanedens TaxID=2961893 RepID=A0ABY7A4Y6_9PSED|nr:3-hydroxyacyl-CoA dehydrogenase PaaH [Pseudomonas triclosanedens]MCP8466433.1 3-hydroxyacyl-CoA dehydrogenase PaaC [Pseudomonas triclosanedens]MCP8473165.1 3-hydroxyacyl-CoA dehydrogenase PaaC [Pseudomonas triclosanedens]MCP8479042.1 3-hydroxyacyl-CoA dehydrogenase PaaC [Pseudomonas triclosanedens]WAI52153.1 3-hydroxyacyl-CoA dehydrogenase PaaC [Pseudomonas triclosanedens]